MAYKLQSSVKRTEAALNNHQNALSFLQVQDGVLEAMGDIVDRMSELRTMAADVSKNAADVENYSKEFLELQDQLAQMKREKFNGVELFATEEEWETMKGVNKSHLKINGQAYDGNALFKHHTVQKNRTSTSIIPMKISVPTAPSISMSFSCTPTPAGVEADGNIKLNIVNLQFMLGIKNPNVFGIEKNLDTDGDGTFRQTNGLPQAMIPMVMAHRMPQR